MEKTADNAENEKRMGSLIQKTADYEIYREKSGKSFIIECAAVATRRGIVV
ncbi:MAG: hypothetical protein ACI4OB_00810 [Christensenellales bacterium]